MGLLLVSAVYPMHSHAFHIQQEKDEEKKTTFISP